MPEIGLVAGVGPTVEEPASPRDLYADERFRAMCEYAERAHDEWWVLSAERGLLGPRGPPVAPYDRSLTDATDAERGDWAASVVADLRTVGLLESDTTLVVHGPPAYYEALAAHLPKADLRYPTAGLDADERAAWYERRRD